MKLRVESSAIARRNSVIASSSSPDSDRALATEVMDALNRGELNVLDVRTRKFERY